MGFFLGGGLCASYSLPGSWDIKGPPWAWEKVLESPSTIRGGAAPGSSLAGSQDCKDPGGGAITFTQQWGLILAMGGEKGEIMCLFYCKLH